jgi:hypothetical protein
MRPIVRDITSVYSGSRIEFLRAAYVVRGQLQESAEHQKTGHNRGVGTNRYIFMRTNEKKNLRRVPPRHIGRMVETVVGVGDCVLLEMSGWSPQTQFGNLLQGVHSRNG